MLAGRQTPTFEKIGSYSYSRGADAVRMFESYGRNYYDSQRYEMDVFFARNKDGSFAAKDIGITKPRQNGKSFAARDYAIWMSFVEGLTVLYSAHNGGVARKMFREIKAFVTARSDFSEMVESICESRGYEGIYLKNGAYIEFQTRSSGVRGGTYRILIIDEAQELTPEQQNALIPTASAAAELTEANAEPQKIYIGTVPDPSCRGTIFKSMHDRCHDGTSGAWWLEWGVQAQSIDDIDLDDVSLWYETNPAMGRRMSENTVRSERDTMTPDGFARERLGWWSRKAVGTAIDPDSWNALAIDKDEAPTAYESAAAFAFKFAIDGTRGCIAACRKHPDGRKHVEVVEVRPMSGGLDYFERFALMREANAAGFAIDGGGNAKALYDSLEREGVPRGLFRLPSASEVSAACASFLNDVSTGSLTHIAQPGLDESVLGAKKRPIGKTGFGFDGTGTSDPLPIEAAALASWAADAIGWEPETDLEIA